MKSFALLSLQDSYEPQMSKWPVTRYVTACATMKAIHK